MASPERPNHDCPECGPKAREPSDDKRPVDSLLLEGCAVSAATEAAFWITLALVVYHSWWWGIVAAGLLGLWLTGAVAKHGLPEIISKAKTCPYCGTQYFS